jgi:hypothetical protein
VLPLKLALRLFSGQMLVLEGCLSLLEGGPLLLEPGLCRLARALLLPELFLHRGKRGDPARQVGSQLLSLLGPLLGLALPRPCPLEGGAVLLQLSPCRGERRLLLSRRSLGRGQGLARFL